MTTQLPHSVTFEPAATTAFPPVPVDVIAHRGYSAGAPENTPIAFQRAMEMGARSIELDVQWTRDDVPVVSHDPSLGRTIAGSGRIAQLTWAELEGCDAGSWFAPEFADQRVPTLEEILQLVKPLTGEIFLDLKPHCQWSVERVAIVRELLDRYRWRERSVACSFDPDVADRFNTDPIRPMTIGYSISSADSFQEVFPRAVTAGARLICAYDILLADPDLIWEAHASGLEIVAWTVDRAEDVRKLSEFGIDRIITNKLLPGWAI